MKITNDHHEYNHVGAWSHDGEKIVYITDEAGTVWTLRPANSGGLSITCSRSDGADQISIAAAVSNQIVIRAEKR